MDRVFISYSHHDSDFVDKLEHDLRDHGVDVWRDIRDVHPSSTWLKTIEQALSDSDKFLVVLSRESSVSTWVKKEISHAISAGKIIIPILFRLKESPPPLSHIQSLNLTGSASLYIMQHIW